MGTFVVVAGVAVGIGAASWFVRRQKAQGVLQPKVRAANACTSQIRGAVAKRDPTGARAAFAELRALRDRHPTDRYVNDYFLAGAQLVVRQACDVAVRQRDRAPVAYAYEKQLADAIVDVVCGEPTPDDDVAPEARARLLEALVMLYGELRDFAAAARPYAALAALAPHSRRCHDAWSAAQLRHGAQIERARAGPSAT